MGGARRSTAGRLRGRPAAAMSRTRCVRRSCCSLSSRAPVQRGSTSRHPHVRLGDEGRGVRAQGRSGAHVRRAPSGTAQRRRHHRNRQRRMAIERGDEPSHLPRPSEVDEKGFPVFAVRHGSRPRYPAVFNRCGHPKRRSSHPFASSRLARLPR